MLILGGLRFPTASTGAVLAFLFQLLNKRRTYFSRASRFKGERVRKGEMESAFWAAALFICLSSLELPGQNSATLGGSLFLLKSIVASHPQHQLFPKLLFLLRLFCCRTLSLLALCPTPSQSPLIKKQRPHNLSSTLMRSPFFSVYYPFQESSLLLSYIPASRLLPLHYIISHPECSFTTSAPPSMS